MLLFLASLPCDGFYIRQDDQSASYGSGFELLLIGILGPLDGTYAWLANPALLVAWITLPLRPRAVALGFSLAALGIALEFLRRQNVWLNEAGGRGEIAGFGLGYWLWIANIATALAGSVVGLTLDGPAKRPADRLHAEETGRPLDKKTAFRMWEWGVR
jgi:hypothetical protein